MTILGIQTRIIKNVTENIVAMKYVQEELLKARMILLVKQVLHSVSCPMTKSINLEIFSNQANLEKVNVSSLILDALGRSWE